jgi:hypothetical protein
MGSIRPTGFYNYVSRLGGMAQQFITAESANTNKIVALSLKPLIPMIIAGSALVYNQGHESTKPGGGEPGAWMRILAESGLAYAVLENTSGIYPLFGIGLAAYRAGKQSNAMDQVKAVINTAMTLFMGSVGVTFFKGMSNMAAQMDDHRIFRLLHDQNAAGGAQGTHIQDWMAHLGDEAENHHWNQESRQAFGGLHDTLQQLRDRLRQRYPEWLPQADRRPPLHPDSQEFRDVSEHILKLKEDAAEHFAALGEDAFGRLGRDTQQAAKHLMSAIDHSQSTWTRMVRGMNPIFGYIIMGLMVGAPLAKWINSGIGRRRPDLQQKQFQQVLFPQENRLLGGPAGHGGGHGSQAGHGSTYGMPYMTWPGMNNDQITYSGDLTPQQAPSFNAHGTQNRQVQPHAQPPPQPQQAHH